MDLNKVMIIGRLTRDPDARSTPQGASVSSFGVATNFAWTDPQGQKQEKVEFHNVVAWRKLAEICNQYLKKGSRVFVEGRLQTRSWNDPSGVTKYRTEIVAENLLMLDRAPSSGAAPSQAAPAAAGSKAPGSQAAETPATPPPDDEIQIENIPF